MITIKIKFPLLAMAACVALTACGGGGSGGSVTVQAPGEVPAPPPADPAPEEPTTPPRQVDRNFTYHADTRDIIERKCVSCHQEGELAPFALDTYEDVKLFGPVAAYSIEAGTMPPWPPTRGYTPFHDDRSLTRQEKYILLEWIKAGMPEGDPADYQPTQAAAAEVASYNLELPMAQAYTPTLRPDDHRCFAIEWPLDEFTYVTDVNVLPGEKEVVHHVIVSIAEPEDAALYYAAGGEDGRPGWYCLGAGGVRGAPLPRQIGGWVPGVGREPVPEGTGIGVKPGSVMVVQMHYNTLTSEPVPDLSTVQVATQDSVEREAHSFLLADPAWLRPGGMPIPADDPDVTHSWRIRGNALAFAFGESAGVSPGQPWVMHQGFMHMHNLGTRGRTTVQRPDGSEQVILDIRDWDFNWQGTYNFVNEMIVNPQDWVTIECSWDNSQENQEFVGGEQLITRDVEWGDGTQDEMCLMSVYMTPVKDGVDYSYHPTVYTEAPGHLQQFEAGDLVPLKLVFNNFSLHDPGEHDHTMDHGGEHGTAEDDHSQVYAGHYHVYLNTDDDSAEHLTAWDDSYFFQLPEGLAPGIHELRVSLRGADHHALGIEDRVEIEIVEQTGATDESLVDVNQWVAQSVAEDSRADQRPADFSCPDNSWYEEDGALEVETGYCNFLSVTQASLVDVAAGDTLHLVLWHGDLVFEEPATGHASITINGEVAWEAEVAIPGEADIFDVKFTLPFDAPAGSKVEYHVYNHGYNTWTLLQLEVER
jgi:hypothetical protein